MEECIRPGLVPQEDLGVRDKPLGNYYIYTGQEHADSTNHWVASLPGNPLLFNKLAFHAEYWMKTKNSALSYSARRWDVCDKSKEIQVGDTLPWPRRGLKPALALSRMLIRGLQEIFRPIIIDSCLPTGTISSPYISGPYRSIYCPI